MAKKMMTHKQNGHAQPRFVVNAGGRRFVLNDETISRLALMSLNGVLPEINIDGECRYPTVLTLKHFQDFYDREGLATRVVNVYPEECWAMLPEIYETEELGDDTDFEVAWKEMSERLNVMTHLQSADELSGIGNYGVILLGFDDGKELSEPVGGIKDDGTKDNRYTKKTNLVYMRTLSHTYAGIKEYDDNVSSPRYGQPTLYSLSLVQLNSEQLRIPNDQNISTIANQPNIITPVDVHWTRVLHIAESDNTIYHRPRLQNVYNRVLDIKKILGANGQGYWNSGIPSLSIETQPNIEDMEIDIESVKKEVQEFMLGLQRSIAFEGMTAKPLNFTISEPGPNIDAHLKIICVTIGVPMRTFMGVEEAKMASNQEARTWNKRLMRRENLHLTPRMIRPFLNRMIDVGALPKPKKLFVEWPDLNAPTENDRATTAQKVTTALVQYIQGNVFLMMGPREYLVNIIGLTPVKVEAIFKAPGMKNMMAKLNALAKTAMAPPQGIAMGPGNAGNRPGQKRLPRKQKKEGVNDGAGSA